MNEPVCMCGHTRSVHDLVSGCIRCLHGSLDQCPRYHPETLAYPAANEFWERFGRYSWQPATDILGRAIQQASAALTKEEPLSEKKTNAQFQAEFAERMRQCAPEVSTKHRKRLAELAAQQYLLWGGEFAPEKVGVPRVAARTLATFSDLREESTGHRLSYEQLRTVAVRSNAYPDLVNGLKDLQNYLFSQDVNLQAARNTLAGIISRMTADDMGEGPL